MQDATPSSPASADIVASQPVLSSRLSGSHGPNDISSAHDIAERMDAPTLRTAVELRDWLIEVAVGLPDFGEVLAGFAQRLNAMGLPIDRLSTAIDVLHSDYAGIGRTWSRDGGLRISYFPHTDTVNEAYLRSPFSHVHRTREWLFLDLAATPEAAFGVVPELKADGYRHYLCVPLFFSNGSENGVTFATRSAGGFSAHDVDVLRFVMGTFAIVMELRAVSRRLNDVLRIYVGAEPQREILGGAIRRGQVMRIRSAILFADMRNYTGLSSPLSPEQTVALLNTLFDCLVPPIEAQGGEVLKYMGDGVLAIFRDRGDDTGSAAFAALTAAREALARIATLGTVANIDAPLAVGIALHHGEAAYGNVGSGQRLDFTVIGRDVNIASRIAGLNKVLGEPLLMSQTFADHLWAPAVKLGDFALDGIPERVTLFRP
jgi:adenylate cyclase